MVRMASENSIRFAEPFEFRLRKEALVGKRGVERHAAVTLAENQTIPFLPVRILRAELQRAFKKDGDDLDDREGRPQVASTARNGHVDDVSAVPLADALIVVAIHRSQSY